MSKKSSILVIIGCYLPGYKAGGPIRSIANMVEWLGDEFQFYIVTSDRDLGEKTPYAAIESRQWHTVGKANVLYLPPSDFRLRAWYSLLAKLDYDLIYLNSFFSATTRSTLLLRKLKLLSQNKVIIAPRGEFSPGAIALKTYKKAPYLFLTQKLGLYREVEWHASSEYEKKDILVQFSKNGIDVKSHIHIAPIHVAPDLFSKHAQDSLITARPSKAIGQAKIIFLSRIARKKNLDFALQLLSTVQGHIQFDIYGPIEDPGYWDECQRLIAQLPDTIQVHYQGAVTPDQVVTIFSQYHLFLFPTRGENFGHVILEALTAGCPVLLSDQTPWRELAQKNLGWDIPLNQHAAFSAALARLVDMSGEEFETYSTAAAVFARSLSYDPSIIEANRQLFLKVLGH